MQQPAAVRFYSPLPDVRSAGATASSKGFGEREQAQENQYIRKREEELLKAAREKLKAAQAEVDKHTDNILKARSEESK
ncbi:hypothetical protein VHUM_02288 [Vanrija humicola]|uniref:ATPase inhibitor, mitochondrial n=1 Tax=Vanrija humicola TaxID=5417 RepID=A0A7D8Z6G2_VANHU|nr:hypothetical protein VHUM_02288 [Vanrija humicola]